MKTSISKIIASRNHLEIQVRAGHCCLDMEKWSNCDATDCSRTCVLTHCFHDGSKKKKKYQSPNVIKKLNTLSLISIWERKNYYVFCGWGSNISFPRTSPNFWMLASIWKIFTSSFIRRNCWVPTDINLAQEN